MHVSRVITTYKGNIICYCKIFKPLFGSEHIFILVLLFQIIINQRMIWWQENHYLYALALNAFHKTSENFLFFTIQFFIAFNMVYVSLNICFRHHVRIPTKRLSIIYSRAITTYNHAILTFIRFFPYIQWRSRMNNFFARFSCIFH